MMSQHNSGSILVDAWVLMKHVSRISVWESQGLPDYVRLGRKRQSERRRKEISRLTRNIKRGLSQMLHKAPVQ